MLKSKRVGHVFNSIAKKENIKEWREGKWSKHDWLRFWMHLPIGVICASLIYFLPPIGILATIGFMFYEAIEDWKINDLSFKDMLGFLWGFIGTGVTIVIVLKMIL